MGRRRSRTGWGWHAWRWALAADDDGLNKLVRNRPGVAGMGCELTLVPEHEVPGDLIPDSVNTDSVVIVRARDLATRDLIG